MMWSKLNIKFQLIVFMSVVILSVEISTLFFIDNLQKKENRSNAIIEVSNITKSLNNDFLKVLFSSNADTLADITYRLLAFSKVTGVVFYDENNKAVFKYANISNIQKRQEYILKKQIVFTKDNLFIKQNIVADNYSFGFVILDIDLSSYKLKEQELTYTILKIFPFALIFGLIVSLFLSRSYTKPFMELLQAMRNSDPTNDNIVVIDTKANNEIKELFDGFNLLMSQVYKSTQELYLKAEHDKLKEIHKHTQQSIEYASLIQKAIIPSSNTFKEYFSDYFIHWEPKDTVGGDIYLLNELRHKDECLLLFIDCTGHGVPGAFVTMLVKAVQEQLLAQILNNKNIEISTAWIMGQFNKILKVLLKQEIDTSISNAGFDGGIIYYNKKTKILKFSGAETSLYYIDDHNNLNTLKGDRYSVGYKKCSMDFEYSEKIIDITKGMKFYATTDGYLDQNGGEKDFPFGKKRFMNIIKNNHKEPMIKQQEIFLNEMKKYENMIENNDRNDDMTIIGFEI